MFLEREDIMNGYEIMSNSYKKPAEEGKISNETAEKECRIFDFLATCDEDDIYKLFDSSAFNEIVKSYVRIAVRELASEETITEVQAKAVRNRLSLLFDEKTAKDVCEG